MNGSHFDAVIVGSGFGGSINALRLAQGGKSVLVLERGKRYKPGEFPRNVSDVNKLFWSYPRHPASQGLYDVRFFSGLAAVVASGVGGGSLIYANIHIRPDADVFADPRWPHSINRQLLDPYYDKVARMLGIAPIPKDIKLVKRNIYRDAARQTGHEVFDPDMAVSWKIPGGPGRESCQLSTQCEFGCQFGAKNTLDLTYLAQAELLGAQVQTGMYVDHVEPAKLGYRVHFKDLANNTSVECVTGTRVVLSAGTLGTNEILLRSRDIYHSLPLLSRTLGHGYSANGDFLGSIQNSSIALAPWEGPDVTSVIRYNDVPPHFTLAAPTFSRAAMTVLASFGQSRNLWLRPVAYIVWPLLDHLVPWLFQSGLLNHPSKFPLPNAGDPARMTFLFALGRDNANGVMQLNKGNLDIKWDYACENKRLIENMIAAMQAICDIYQGTFAPVFNWSIFRKIMTVHSLGGCHLSESPQTGVVSLHGEVHNYPGLFISDGSVIPSSIGFHPAMTISAISEYIAEAVLNSYACA